MGPGARRGIGLDDDHHVERLGKELVQGRKLVDLGPDAFLGACLLEILGRQLAILDAVTVFLVRPVPAIGPVIQEVERRIDRQLRDQL